MTAEPTPRTDAKWHECSDELPFTLAASDPIGGLGEIVPADFARQLERELSLAQSRLAEVEKAGREFLERYDLLEPDLSGVFTFYAVHGMKWPEDRNWKSELEALREAIKRSSAPSQS